MFTFIFYHAVTKKKWTLYTFVQLRLTRKMVTACTFMIYLVPSIWTSLLTHVVTIPRTRFSCLYDSHDISQIHTIYKNFYDFFSTISFLISIDLTICHGAIEKRMDKILVMVKLTNNLTRYLKLKILKFKYMICPLLLDIFQNYFPKMNVSFLLF